MLEIIIAFYTVKEKRKKENELMIRLSTFAGQTISWDSEPYVILRELVITRREKRFHWIEVGIYLCRFCMLVSSLRVVGHTWLDPIFVSICGLVQSMFNVFKSMKGKKNFYKLTIDEINHKQS